MGIPYHMTSDRGMTECDECRCIMGFIKYPITYQTRTEDKCSCKGNPPSAHHRRVCPSPILSTSSEHCHCLFVWFAAFQCVNSRQHCVILQNAKRPDTDMAKPLFVNMMKRMQRLSLLICTQKTNMLTMW